MKKVVFNTWQGAFFNPGGGEVQLLESKKALEKLNVEVELFSPWKPSVNCDLYHHFSIGTGAELVIKEYKALGKPVALSTIMWTIPPKDSFIFSHINNLLRISDKLLTNSDLESKRLSEAFDIPIEKFVKTRNSISDKFLEPGQESIFKKKYKISEQFILTVANIDERKNTKSLLEATKDLGVQVVLVGHVRDNQYFNEFKDLYDHYVYLGPIEDDELLRSAYTGCTLFALPSICETPSIAALEAASQGAKIVITSEGSTREYFKSAATYVDPSSITDIRKGILNSLELQKNIDLSSYIKNHYTWDKTAEDILNCYKSLIIK